MQWAIKLTVRQVPLIATLAPIWMPSAEPGGKAIARAANSPCRRTDRTVALPCTMPAVALTNPSVALNERGVGRLKEMVGTGYW